MNRWMRKMNVTKMVPFMMKRKNNHNALWLSLLGIGLAGGATAYGMTKGKNNENVQNFIQGFTKKMKNMNSDKMLQTN